MALEPGARLGPYEIVSPAGGGGMGEVYRGRDTRLDRTVAIKVLPPDLTTDSAARQRFEREARAVAALSHPHICGLFDIGTPPAPSASAPYHAVPPLKPTAMRQPLCFCQPGLVTSRGSKWFTCSTILPAAFTVKRSATRSRALGLVTSTSASATAPVRVSL